MAHRETEAKATAEMAAQAAATFKRADDAFECATAARNAEVKNAEAKAKAAHEAKTCLATVRAAEGLAHHELFWPTFTTTILATLALDTDIK